MAKAEESVGRLFKQPIIEYRLDGRRVPAGTLGANHPLDHLRERETATAFGAECISIANLRTIIGEAVPD